ncbi:MAG: hypothetical protein D6765_06235 [Bacteroidetes bacterium]|nr:MAG: hypothetical protein D6765_06235 [Bacteroidota bacterium]
MKEKNRQTLKDALRRLPGYEPGERVWARIEGELERESREAPLRQALQELPEYEPPERVWDSIQRRLDEGPRRRWLSGARLRVAAAVALLILGVWALLPYLPSQNTPELHYATETVDPALLQLDWEEDQEAFEAWKALCREKLATCRQPEVLELQNELQELEEARRALRQALGQYGTDLQLIAQMRHIELQRTEVLKEIIEKLI